MIKLRTGIDDLEQGKIDPELLKIKLKLAKDPADYAVNNLNKKIGMLVGAKAGDIIWYFKTDNKKMEFQLTLKKLAFANTKKCLWLQSKMHLKF